MAVRVCDYRTVFVSSVCLVKYTLRGTIVTSLLLIFITNLVDIDSLSASYEVFRRKLVIVCAITRLEALSQARLIQPTCVGNKFGASLPPYRFLLYILFTSCHVIMNRHVTVLIDTSITNSQLYGSGKKCNV